MFLRAIRVFPGLNNLQNKKSLSNPFWWGNQGKRISLELPKRNRDETTPEQGIRFSEIARI